MSTHSLTERSMKLFHGETEEIPTIMPVSSEPELPPLYADDARRAYWSTLIMLGSGLLAAIGFVLVVTFLR